MHKVAFLASSLGLAIALTGCVAPQTQALRAQALTAPAAKPVELTDVPFFAQEDHQCGPAALATVLKYSGADVSPAELVPEVYTPGRKGSFQVEMIAAARRHGRMVYSIQENLESILAALQEGIPVLVLQNNSLPIYPVWHYAVVVGADRQREVFILRSGKTQRLEIPFSTFERTWARSGYWAMLVLDPATLSDGLDQMQVVRQLAELESEGQYEAAQAGFWRAVLNWPSNVVAWLGYADTSAQLHDDVQAESAFRELVRRQPLYGPGLNNYADFLLKRGRAVEALPYAQRAVKALDVEATHHTLASVQAALASAGAASAAPASAESSDARAP